MRNICIFISVFLISSVAYGGTAKKTTLTGFLQEVYEEPANPALPQITEQLQKHLPSCPLETTLAEGSDFLSAVSCVQLMSRARDSSLSRFKMNNLIVKLGDEGAIDEARQGELSAVLEEVYEPESSQKVQEREQLINHFQECDPDYSWVDSAKFWSEAFSCKGVIETAKEAGVAYSDVQDAIDAALLPSEGGQATAKIPEDTSSEDKPRRTSKP